MEREGWEAERRSARFRCRARPRSRTRGAEFWGTSGRYTPQPVRRRDTAKRESASCHGSLCDEMWRETLATEVARTEPPAAAPRSERAPPSCNTSATFFQPLPLRRSPAGRQDLAEAGVLAQVPPPPAASRVGDFRVRRHVPLEQVDRLVLVAQQRAHERLEGNELQIRIELGSAPGPFEHAPRAVLQTRSRDHAAHDHLTAEMLVGALRLRRKRIHPRQQAPCP